ncbi:DUF4012 domain-containing protein [Nocardioides maradonensis]
MRVTSRVLDDLAGQGIEPLVAVSHRVDGLLPKNGAIDLEAFRALRRPVAQAQASFARADQELSAQDSSGYVGPLAARFTEFRDDVHSAATALASADRATTLLPTLLGDRRPRTYLLALENNAEVRGTGGLPGVVVYLRARDGHLSIVREASGASFGQTAKPALPLTKPERTLYSSLLGTDFRDMTMTPDVPRAAALMRARSEQRFPATRLDGVVMVDTVTMAYLLDATGPIDVAGVHLTGADVVDELLHRTYLRLPDPAQQDLFFAGVAATAFQRFTDGAGSPKALMSALSRATSERRLAVHLFDDAQQQDLSGTAIAGELDPPTDDDRPRVAVTLNDTTGAKMSYYLRSAVQVSPTSCTGGTQQLTGQATLSSTAPKDAARLPAYITGGGVYGIQPGSQLVALRIFAPTGGSLSGFTIDGRKSHLETVDQDGRQVGMTFLQLDPGQQVHVGWTMSAGAGQRGGAVVTTTPSIEEQPSVTTLASAC